MFEEELDNTLFVSKGKSITLTDEGIFLKRRALEILNLEELTLEGRDYIRIKDSDHWGVRMYPDDLLADKEYIEKKDLLNKSLILQERMGVQSGLANCVIAWRRNIPYSQAVNKMIKEINAFQV